MLTLKPLALTSLALGVGLALGGCAAPTGSEPSESTSAALVEDEMKQPVDQQQMGPEQGQQGPIQGQEGPMQGQQGQPGQENVLIDPETGEPVLDPETGKPIQLDPETGEPLLGEVGEPSGQQPTGQQPTGEQTGEAPAAATFFRGGWGWGRPGWGGGWGRGWGWGRPGWGWGGGWGRGWGWGGRPGWGWGGGWGRGWW